MLINEKFLIQETSTVFLEIHIKKPRIHLKFTKYLAKS